MWLTLISVQGVKRKKVVALRKDALRFRFLFWEKEGFYYGTENIGTKLRRADYTGL